MVETKTWDEKGWYRLTDAERIHGGMNEQKCSSFFNYVYYTVQMYGLTSMCNINTKSINMLSYY